VVMTVIAGVDGSGASSQALRWAAREAQWRDEPLVAVMAWGFLDQHTAEPGAPFDPAYGHAQATGALATYVRSALPEAVADAVELRAVCDLPAAALVAAASARDLLVVGSRGLGGFRGLLLGSVSRRCVHEAPCPVGVVRESSPGDGARHGLIVVGVDGSDGSRRAVTWALAEARLRGATVELVHDSPVGLIGADAIALHDGAAVELEAERVFDGVLLGQDLRGVHPPVRRTTTFEGAAASILRRAEGADLVVVGSHGRSTLARLALGSVSSQVVHHSDRPVVVVP
ncbi:MAG: universal stress protein, partial [Acidimicrobiia bacterium]